MGNHNQGNITLGTTILCFHDLDILTLPSLSNII